MKCPKCDYLGFDTGDRCKNCGYDFSLLAIKDSGPDMDLTLQMPERHEPSDPLWLDRLDRIFGDSLAAQDAIPSTLDTLAIEPAASPETVQAPAAPILPARAELPLLALTTADDDEPLIKLPTAPRPPLAVRRTPDNLRFRSVPKPVNQPEPALDFADEPPASRVSRRAESSPRPEKHPAPVVAREPSAMGLRVAAAVIDHAILLAIDVVVVYFTLRMAALTMDEWRQLPPVPLLAFLGLLKFAYFWAFTTVGGQTIGKMAAGIQVVADDDAIIDPLRAVQRALAGLLSILTLGLAFVPAFIGVDRRTLHDRMTRTRVVARPST